MNNPAYQAYSIRQLSPFQGMIQVLRSEYARALSGDGNMWQIQVSCEVHQQQWGIMNQPEVQRRYVLYGMWNSRTGLYNLPLDPTLDIPADDIIQDTLISALEKHVTDLPFVQADRYELWLLDDHGLPLALLSSAVDEHQLDSIEVRRWRARADNSRQFIPARAECTGDPILTLERLIKDNHSRPPLSQWFLRHDNGSGTGMLGHNLPASLLDRNLPAEQFPELLIREHWPDKNTQQLCEDYHHWLAPRLLALQTLSDSTRQRLESAAQQQALEASRFYALYPTVIDQKIMNKILVEARLRKSTPSGG